MINARRDYETVDQHHFPVDTAGGDAGALAADTTEPLRRCSGVNLNKPFGPQFLAQTPPFCLYPASQAQFRAAQAESWIQGLCLSAGSCRLLAPGQVFKQKRHLIVSGSKTPMEHKLKLLESGVIFSHLQHFNSRMRGEGRRFDVRPLTALRSAVRISSRASSLLPCWRRANPRE